MIQKIELYIVSLLFLFVLIAINQVPVCWGADCEWLGLGEIFLVWPPILLFCSTGIVLSFIFLRKFHYQVIQGGTYPAETISAIQDIQFENLSFLATYIIPLVCFDLDFHLTAGRNFLMLVLVIALIGWIYIKVNLFYTNPTLAVLNFKIYRITTDKSSDIVVITRHKLETGSQILLKPMDSKIFFGTLYTPET